MYSTIIGSDLVISQILFKIIKFHCIILTIHLNIGHENE